MPSAVETLIEALTAPLLEPEISGEQIGRNRISVIQRLSEVLGNARIQVWLVQQHGDLVETRLGYLHPMPSASVAQEFRGHIVVGPTMHSDKKTVGAQPSAALTQTATRMFEKLDPTSVKIQVLPIQNPIPAGVANGTQLKRSEATLGWIFISRDTELEIFQLAAAKALAFNLAILLQYGRSHRTVEATRECTALLYHSPTLAETFEKCADVLVKSCAAQGGGYLEFVDGCVKSLGHVANSWLTEKRRKEIERFARTEVVAIPTLNDFAISISKGRELQSNAQFGNFLYVPIMGPSLLLETSDFIAISDADDSGNDDTQRLGTECEAPSHALFLVGKKSPQYLGVNFSETDRVLCRSIARGLSTAAYAKFFEELFLSQAKYFSSVSPSDGMNVEIALESIRNILPGARSLQLVTVVRDPAGIYRIGNGSEDGNPLVQAIKDAIIAQAQKLHASVVAESDDSENDGKRQSTGLDQFKTIECACHVEASNDVALIFQMKTRYEPLRFYVLRLASDLLEKYRFRLLKHFMRELYYLHRTKDSADERSSLLAQIRHAVVNPIAAATNNIDTFQKHCQLYGRTEEGWLKIRSNKEIRDLIPHAIYLNNQALLFINSGKFLFSSLGYGDIRFDQYRPLDLVNDVKLAFNYGLQERAQSWNLKIIGDANQSAVGDKVLLWITLANLIDNAIKYGHRETEIGVVLEFRQDRWIFSIENTGDFLDKKLADRIFKPFERGDSAAPNINRRHGTGLGVTVSEMILRAHSGTAGLKYDSQFRSGEQKKALTRFTFEMPYKLSRA